MSTAENTPSVSMETLDRQLIPVLTQLMMLSTYNDQHPYVIWLYNWMTLPERSAEEFAYVVGPLQECVKQNMVSGSDDITANPVAVPKAKAYCVAKTVAEALSVQCPLFVGHWETVVRHLVKIFHPDDDPLMYNKLIDTLGPTSTRLSTWIINIVGDADLCSSPDMRVKMLTMYKNLVKINDDNHKQALESLISACFLLEGHRSYTMQKNGNLFLKLTWIEIQSCMALFKKGNYLTQFDLRISEQLKHHRDMRKNIFLNDISSEYSMCLKTLSVKREVQILTMLLKYASYGTRIDYQTFPETNRYEDVDKCVNNTCGGLHFVVDSFKRAVQDPELLSVTAEAVMDVIEAMVVFLCKGADLRNHMCEDDMQRRHWHRYHRIFWWSNLQICINPILVMLCDVTIHRCSVNENPLGQQIIRRYNETPIGQQIIRRYKARICKMRQLIQGKIVEDFPKNSPMIYNIIYNDEY